MRDKNGKHYAEYKRLYFQLKRVMTHNQIQAAVLQQVTEWNIEIEASIKKERDLLAYFRASRMTGLVTVKSLTQSYLAGLRSPPQWLIIALTALVKRQHSAKEESSK